MSKKTKVTMKSGDGKEIDLTARFAAMQIEHPMLRAIGDSGAKDLVAALRDNESEILADIQKTAENRESEDDPVKFKVSLGITLDLDKSTIETSFSYSVKKTVKQKHAFSSDNAPELPWKEGDE